MAARKSKPRHASLIHNFLSVLINIIDLSLDLFMCDTLFCVISSFSLCLCSAYLRDRSFASHGTEAMGASSPNRERYLCTSVNDASPA